MEIATEARTMLDLLGFGDLWELVKSCGACGGLVFYPDMFRSAVQ